MSYVDLSRDLAAVRRIVMSLGLAQAHEDLHVRPLVGGVSSGIWCRRNYRIANGSPSKTFEGISSLCWIST